MRRLAACARRRVQPQPQPQPQHRRQPHRRQLVTSSSAAARHEPWEAPHSVLSDDHYDHYFAGNHASYTGDAPQTTTGSSLFSEVEEIYPEGTGRGDAPPRPDYAAAAAYFRRALANGDEYVTTACQDPELLRAHSTDWIRRWPPAEHAAFGTAGGSVLVKPGSTEEVAAVLDYCHEHAIPVVPQGGNTGMVGGSTPVADEVVLSLSRLNAVHDLDALEGVLTCGAGCVLEELNAACNELGYEMPLDLGAKGSCQIGGNLSTHAGGVRFVRHGPLRAYVLALAVVDGRGRVLRLGSRMRKDNTGPDLKQLFVGSEGTLGVITEVTLALPRAPRGRQVALLAARDFTAACAIMAAAKASLGEVLGACEWFDGRAFRHVLGYTEATGGAAANPFGPDAEPDAHAGGYVLVEAAGSVPEHDMVKLEAFLEGILEGSVAPANESAAAVELARQAVADDAVLAQDMSQAATLWTLRELCPTALTGSGLSCYKYDISLPLKLFEPAMDATRQRLREHGLREPDDAELVCWGHLGDGNLHLNIVSRAPNEAIPECLEPWLFEWVARAGGSISAEHGVGRCKNELMPLIKSSEVLEVMGDIKEVFDPKGILNPGKMLPAEMSPGRGALNL